MIMLKDLIKKILKLFGIGASNTVDYISLGESLPTPLTPEEEQEAIKLLKQGCSPFAAGNLVKLSEEQKNVALELKNRK